MTLLIIFLLLMIPIGLIWLFYKKNKLIEGILNNQ